MEDINIEELIAKLWSIGLKNQKDLDTTTLNNIVSNHFNNTENNQLKHEFQNIHSEISELKGMLTNVSTNIEPIVSAIAQNKDMNDETNEINILKAEKDNVISSKEQKINVLNGQIANLTEQNTDLTKKYNDVQNKLSEKEADITFNNQEISRLNLQIDTLLRNNNQLTNEINKYRNQLNGLDEIIAIKNKINTLSPDVKEYLKDLCGSFDIIALLSLGRDDNKIKQLWQYLKDRAISNKPDVEILNDYFEFCLFTYNSTQPANERYMIRNISVNDGYNMEYCIRTEDSRSIGEVREVITHCYTKDECVIYKAIVRIN